jgi:exopolysaccharide production protein ExoZ
VTIPNSAATTVIPSSLYEILSNKFELSREGVGTNNRSMEGLRGLAILLVFVAHYITLTEAYVSNVSWLQLVLFQLNRYGAVGVELFFILSGYLIYGSLISREQKYFTFLGKRIRRLYPVFTVVFIIYLFLSYAFPIESKIPRDPISAMGFIIANYLMLPPLLPMKNMIVVAWSLSYEMLFYIITPIVIRFFGMREWTAKKRVVFFIALTLISIILFGIYGGHVRMVMFISGMILFEIIRSNTLRAPSSLVAAVALLASAGYLIPGDKSEMARAAESAILYFCFFILCFTCLGRKNAVITKIFCWTPLRWLGNISYSFYLMHGLAIKGVVIVVAKLIPPDGHSPLLASALLLPIFASSVLASVVLFLLIERPYSLNVKKT